MNPYAALVRRGVVLGALVVVGALPVGCGTTDLRTTPLTPSRRPFVKDIPVPMSFELVDSLSRSYRTESYRIIRHSYFGYAAPITVHAFYRDEMPKAGWRFMSDRNADGTYQMFYQKGNEIADVRVSPDTQALRAGALVTVIVKPADVPPGLNE